MGLWPTMLHGFFGGSSLTQSYIILRTVQRHEIPPTLHAPPRNLYVLLSWQYKTTTTDRQKPGQAVRGSRQTGAADEVEVTGGGPDKNRLSIAPV